MTVGRETRSLWLRHVFSSGVDFYEMLNRQASKTLEGVEALSSWIKEGAEERCQKVRDLEREADELKLTLGRELEESFVTPFDREDIYDLSLRMDEIINACKAAVREIEVVGVLPGDDFLGEMSMVLVEGTRCLVQGFQLLKSDPKAASAQALLARKSENRLAKIYGHAMRELFALSDIKWILRASEGYRSMVRAAERLDAVGEKMLHVIVKIA